MVSIVLTNNAFWMINILLGAINNLCGSHHAFCLAMGMRDHAAERVAFSRSICGRIAMAVGDCKGVYERKRWRS